MYSLFWYAIPGPRWVKALVTLAILVGVFFLLMEVIFPYISSLMPYNDVGIATE